MDIYDIDNERIEAIKKIEKISKEIDSEYSKNLEKVDKNKIFNLMYQQFIQGLKINTGAKYY